MIKVEPVIMGVPAEGYLLKEVRVSPEQIKVFGAKKVLEKLKTFSTESVDIEGANKSIVAKVHITPPEENVRLANGDVVEVRPVIMEKEEEREFKSLPIITVPPGRKMTLDPDRINLILRGAKSKLAHIKPEDLIATVDFLNIPKGQSKTTPKLSLPEGISLVKMIPDQVDVGPIIMENREFRSIPVVVIPPGMRVMLNPPRVNVLLYGPKNKLARIKSEDIIAIINFHDLPKGENKATPKLSLPKGIFLVKIIPDRVEVNTVAQGEGKKLLRPKPDANLPPDKPE
jgi:YbbR domain-containing protein